jgi:hypothetical protein
VTFTLLTIKWPKYREFKPINWIPSRIVPDKVNRRRHMRQGTYILFPNWVKSVRSLILIRNNENSGTMGTCATYISKDPPKFAKCLSHLYDNCVDPTKAPNNIVLRCKAHYIDCLINKVLTIILATLHIPQRR